MLIEKDKIKFSGLSQDEHFKLIGKMTMKNKRDFI